MKGHNQTLVWILKEGGYFQERGLVVCAAKTKAAMLRWIKVNYPNHKRIDIRNLGEIYFEGEESQTWLRCEDFDKCPLVEEAK